MTEAAAAPEGALSMDAAVSLLSAPPEQEQPQPAQAAEAEPNEAPPTGEEAASEADEPGDGETEESTEAAAEPVDAPQWWDAEDKARFAELSPEMQAIVAKQEGKREAITSKTKAEATEARRRADAEAQTLGQLKTALDQIIPQAQQTFRERWADFTDLALAQHSQLGSEEAIQAMQWKAARDAELGELNRLQAAKQAADQQAYQRFQEVEGERLRTLAPDLVDPEKGEERKAALATFLVSQGIPREALGQADAAQLSLAYDAMRYRQLASSAKQALAPKPAPAAPAKPGLKPAATGAVPKQTEIARLTNRLAQTRSTDDAVALMLAKGI